MEPRKKEIRRNIRRLTKLIGEAKRASDFNEVENLRNQRGNWQRQLVEEFEEMFVVKNGKTEFLPIEEAVEFYQNEDNKKRIAASNALNQLLQAREQLKKRHQAISDDPPETVKKKILNEVVDELGRVESIIQDLNKQAGNDKIDFDAIDKNREEKDDLLDGIDMSSLE